MNPRLSKRLAIVPAFNEASSIAAVIEQIQKYESTFDVVVIDDGSHDNTINIARQHGAAVVPLPFNLGIGGAVQAGFLYADEHDYDVAVQVDGDGQHDPQEISKILAPLLAGKADVVVGSRYLDGGEYKHALHRRFLIGMFSTMVTIATGKQFTDTSSSFRAYNRRAIRICADD